MGCGTSSPNKYTRAADLPANPRGHVDTASLGCISYVSEQELDESEVSSLPSEASSQGEVATERPSLLKMRITAKVLEARVLHGIDGNPNQFDDEWKDPHEYSQSKRKSASIAQFVDDHVQSIALHELEEEASRTPCEDVNSVLGLSVSVGSAPSGSNLTSPGSATLLSGGFDAKSRRQSSTHFQLPNASLRGQLDYRLLSMAAESEGTESLALGQFLKRKRRSIRKLKEELPQLGSNSVPLDQQLRLATATRQLDTDPESPASEEPLTANVLLATRDSRRLPSLEVTADSQNSLQLGWILNGKSNRRSHTEQELKHLCQRSRSNSLLGE